MSGALHMVQLVVNARRLFAHAHAQGHRAEDVDEGYAAHAALDASFGDAAPQPFCVRTDPSGRTSVLGYAVCGIEALREQAQTFATPDAWSVWDWDRSASKEMRATFAPGTELGFEVRACPMVRLARGYERVSYPGTEPGPRKKGAETDAFQADWFRASAAGTAGPQSREEAYLPWLRRELERDGAAAMLRAELAAFHRVRVYRRMAAAEGTRRSSISEKPDARFRGTLRVTDSGAFSRLLARGVGRHRAFGFGMLLLRPAS